MILKKKIHILGIILLASCNNSSSQTDSVTPLARIAVKLDDSSRSKLLSALDSVVESNSAPDDITISGRFISQGKYENGDNYIIVSIKSDSSITLINPLGPLKDGEITKLKKEGNNITLTYSASDKKVKFLAAEYESEK
jgi:hypothetical protein